MTNVKLNLELKMVKETTETQDPRESTLLAQVAKTQESIESTSYRVEVLERALKYKEMTFKEREEVEGELEAIKKLLDIHQKTLKALQTENTRTASVAWLIVILCFAVYCLYCFFTNPK